MMNEEDYGKFNTLAVGIYDFNVAARPQQVLMAFGHNIYFADRID